MKELDKISIIVIDDHPIFRQGVVDSFSLEEEFIVVDQASDGESGLSLIQQLKPDVAVIDVNLPGINGQQITREIVDQKLPTRVILLTAYDDVDQKIQAISAGAAAYCTKDVIPEDLVDVIRSVAQGKYVLDGREVDGKQINQWLGTKIDGAKRLFSDPGEPYQPLSSREMQILKYLTQGNSNKEIALILGISHQTVKNHVTSVLRKLGVDDRTQAALYALRQGWVRLNQPDTDSQE
jgi:DNA-binding NarL/FixJ family response regulator